MEFQTDFPHSCKYSKTSSAEPQNPLARIRPAKRADWHATARVNRNKSQSKPSRYEVRGTKAFAVPACIVLEALEPMCFRQRVWSRNGETQCPSRFLICSASIAETYRTVEAAYGLSCFAAGQLIGRMRSYLTGDEIQREILERRCQYCLRNGICDAKSVEP